MKRVVSIRIKKKEVRWRQWARIIPENGAKNMMLEAIHSQGNTRPVPQKTADGKTLEKLCR